MTHRITKQQWQRHEAAVRLIESKGELSWPQVEYVLEHWQPAATNDLVKAGMFFTPMGMAWDIAAMHHLVGEGGSHIDLCAGIGRLTYNWVRLHEHDKRPSRFVAVELNQRNVEIGRRILPMVEWVQADAFDLARMQRLGTFHIGVSNPPFNKAPTTRHNEQLKYRGMAELQAAEVLTHLVPRSSSYLIAGRNVLDWGERGQEVHPVSEEYKRWQALHPEWVLTRTSLEDDRLKFQDTDVAYSIAELARKE